MIRQARIAAVIGALLLAVTACAPSSGALGTPATPAATATAPAPAPSDVLPSDALPSAGPTSPAVPTAAPTGTSSASPATPSATAPTTVPSASPRPATAAPATPAPSPVPTMVVRAYFVLGTTTGNEGLVPVLRTVPKTDAVATAAVDALLRGPTAAERTASISTAIPGATRLVGISIKDGVATVNLSSAFESGGGSLSMSARLAQLVYTVTQFPTVDAVRLELDGRPVNTLGGEGLVLDGPVGRADVRDMLPAIFVDRPAFGAAIGNPASVSGLANVFEATFRVQLLDGGGAILADEQVMASCGTGCWGTFATTIGYDVAEAQYGTLRVFDRSAKDGSPENVTSYRVWLTPAG